MAVTAIHKCKRCGVSMRGRDPRATYCTDRCRGGAFKSCPIEGCRGAIKRSTLAVCSSCWSRIPAPLRHDFVQAYHDWRNASYDQRSERLAALDELRDLVFVTAESSYTRQIEQAQRRAAIRRRSALRLAEEDVLELAA